LIQGKVTGSLSILVCSPGFRLEGHQKRHTTILGHFLFSAGTVFPERSGGFYYCLLHLPSSCNCPERIWGFFYKEKMSRIFPGVQKKMSSDQSRFGSRPVCLSVSAPRNEHASRTSSVRAACCLCSNFRQCDLAKIHTWGPAPPYVPVVPFFLSVGTGLFAVTSLGRPCRPLQQCSRSLRGG
jgi:hypothetical protein